MTIREIFETPEFQSGKMRAIIREVPKGSGRRLLFGFERPKTSRKRHVKYMLKNPVSLNDLAKGPIRQPSLTAAGN